ncbi:MAG: hypothetical protein ACM3NT_06560 [Methylocystaceae bacterium]
MENNLLSELPLTVFESSEFRALLEREEGVGAQKVMDELLSQTVLSNAQLMWLLKHMLFYYGSKDKTLAAAPPERLLENMGHLLRITYMIIDSLDPRLDENIRLYISTKLKQATWGLSPDIRQYLDKKR